MMQNPIWNENISLPEFNKLEGDIKTDVLIIGGGLCGILCAYFLEWTGVDYCLIEADRIAGGVTGRTTAKISALQSLTYSDIIKRFGREKAKLYFDSCIQSLERYGQMSQSIDCDFEYKPAYTYSLSNRKKLEEEIRAIRCIGGQAEMVEKLPLPFEVLGAVKMPRQAQFHPLKFISGICKGLNIYEKTRITKLIGKRAIFDNGSITAKKIIVTTHFPFINKYGGYFLKLYQNRSYMIGVKNAADLDGMYLDENSNGLSFCNQGDVLLIGSGSHRTGKQDLGWKKLRDFKEKYYPEAKEYFAWATQDCMSLDGIPYIGKYSKYNVDLFVATGFNKWGMTSSMTAALMLRDMVLERENEFEELFSPQRNMLSRQLLCNCKEAIVDMLSPTLKRCPHLGCALKWNKAEHSWDCPCHGSRFSESGKLLDNPANGNIKGE